MQVTKPGRLPDPAPVSAVLPETPEWAIGLAGICAPIGCGCEFVIEMGDTALHDERASKVLGARCVGVLCPTCRFLVLVTEPHEQEPAKPQE